jgi:hypothetical protein
VSPVSGYSNEMFSREEANPDKFIEQADIPEWARDALSKSIVLLQEGKTDVALEKLVVSEIECRTRK